MIKIILTLKNFVRHTFYTTHTAQCKNLLNHVDPKFGMYRYILLGKIKTLLNLKQKFEPYF